MFAACVLRVLRVLVCACFCVSAHPWDRVFLRVLVFKPNFPLSSIALRSGADIVAIFGYYLIRCQNSCVNLPYVSPRDALRSPTSCGPLRPESRNVFSKLDAPISFLNITLYFIQEEVAYRGIYNPSYWGYSVRIARNAGRLPQYLGASVIPDDDIPDPDVRLMQKISIGQVHYLFAH